MTEPTDHPPEPASDEPTAPAGPAQASLSSAPASPPSGSATLASTPASQGARDPSDTASSGRVRASTGVSRTLLGIVAAVALLASLGVWLDGRRMDQELRAEVAQRLAGVDAATESTGKAQAQMAAQVRDAQAKITLLETRLAESQAQQAALEALYRDLAPSRDEIALSEIEQVLLVANQQLQLAGNVASALTALQLAEAKLQRLDRPQFVPLRRALARDVDRLKAMPYVDVAGMSVKLDQALAGIDKLPLAMDERLPPPAAEGKAPAADESAWRRFLREAWADVKQLIRVEVADRPAAPLVPPAQQYFLRENLRLRLLTARIALLAHDDASFQSDLAASDAWLAQYFDVRAKPVQSLQSTLKQLATTPMPGSIPDLAGSLEALRVLRLAQDRAPARAAAPR